MTRRAVVALVLAMLASACSQPPDKEHQQAIGALEAARAAGADTYATDEFQDAQAALKRYDDSVAQRDYRQALNNALEARDLAYDAAKQAANKKAELRSQAERLAGELDTLVTNATARLTAPNARSLGPGASRLRSARDAARASLQEARTRIQSQGYADAVARLTPAIDRLRREMSSSEAPASKRKK